MTNKMHSTVRVFKSHAQHLEGIVYVEWYKKSSTKVEEFNHI